MFSGGDGSSAGELADDAEHDADIVEEAVLLRRVVLVREEEVPRVRPHQREQRLLPLGDTSRKFLPLFSERQSVLNMS